LCPFCGAKAACAALPDDSRAAGGRLSRSALFAVGAVGAALASASCTTNVQPLYGAVVPPDEAGVDSSSAHDGAASDGNSEPDVSSIALYGAPPPQDAGDKG
jgi:hypothetical protein